MSGLNLAETLYPANYQIQRHSHECLLFYLVKDGSFTQSYGRETREGIPLSVIVLPADQDHADNFHGRGGNLFVIESGPEWTSKFRQHSVLPDESVHFNKGIVPWLVTRIYEEYNRFDNVSALAIEGLTLELMAEISRRYKLAPERHPPRWLIQTKELLHAHFSDQITLENIARTVNAHPTHLARTFRRHYGCTVGEYIRRLRIDFVCRQLIFTDEPLSQIALAAGFYDQSHFSKTFNRATGLTPSNYRANFRRC